MPSRMLNNRAIKPIFHNVHFMFPSFPQGAAGPFQPAAPNFKQHEAPAKIAGASFFSMTQPFTAPAMKLSLMVLLRKMYMISVGNVASTRAAPMGPHSVVY